MFYWQAVTLTQHSTWWWWLQNTGTLLTGQPTYVQRNSPARSGNHCCCGKATSITYFCVCSLIYPAREAHAPYYTVICGLWLHHIFRRYPITPCNKLLLEKLTVAYHCQEIPYTYGKRSSIIMFRRPYRLPLSSAKSMQSTLLTLNLIHYSPTNTRLCQANLTALVKLTEQQNMWRLEKE
jgi:hypothetical protein